VKAGHWPIQDRHPNYGQDQTGGFARLWLAAAVRALDSTFTAAPGVVGASPCH
jgi:hypothetical protein